MERNTKHALMKFFDYFLKLVITCKTVAKVSTLFRPSKVGYKNRMTC
ncbi:hypothetical protein MtrunA17_Chr1g0153771 [Medicago truncatula]|uniref:Uncharacterized protein n=1 Tax=Medicago truncatula TaxID=3880 RepID=A0A396JKY7_MEDTR|nr:hypothetical protein MtrunA17_Chr1g0153771 [Medicago truncatula]